jgi:diazepam-binding inhibitor (GABA receptor modulating acyl-CoA-binding protein)
MSNLEEIFTKATSLRGLNPTNDQLKLIYAYYKQATIGNINIDRPTSLFKIKEKQKWDAWKSVENTSSEHAKIKYIDIVYRLTGDEYFKLRIE